MKYVLSGLDIMLKSDHFGIEIAVIILLEDVKKELKSDHFGIEMKEAAKKLCLTELKSDHFGIEIKSASIVGNDL